MKGNFALAITAFPSNKLHKLHKLHKLTGIPFFQAPVTNCVLSNHGLTQFQFQFNSLLVICRTVFSWISIVDSMKK